MTQLWNTARNLKMWGDSRGQDMIEYALTAGFIALAVVSISPTLGTSLVTVFSNVVAQLQNAGGGGGIQASPAV